MDRQCGICLAPLGDTTIPLLMYSDTLVPTCCHAILIVKDADPDAQDNTTTAIRLCTTCERTLLPRVQARRSRSAQEAL